MPRFVLLALLPTLLLGCMTVPLNDVDLFWAGGETTARPDWSHALWLKERVKVGTFVDRRPNPRELGRRPMEGEPPMLVTTRTDVPDWCAQQLGRLLAARGF